MNNFIHSLIHNYPDLSSYAREYGRDSNKFNLSSPENLYTQFLKLFKNTKNPNLKNFANSNLFLKNFIKVDVPGETYFYPGLMNDSKDEDYVAAVQKAYLDVLNIDTTAGVTTEEAKEIKKFMQDLATATIVAQGFNIKRKSIQPFLPLQAYMDLAADLSVLSRKLGEELSKGNPRAISFIEQATDIFVKYFSKDATKRRTDFQNTFPIQRYYNFGSKVN